MTVDNTLLSSPRLRQLPGWGMGQGPMSTCPGSVPCAMGRACPGRTELISRGAHCLAAASGWVHAADAASRALASFPHCPSFALDKRVSAASAHVQACEWVQASVSAAGPGRVSSDEAGERSEPNLFIGHFGTRMQRRTFNVMLVWVFEDGRECFPWRLWETRYRFGKCSLEPFYQGDFWPAD
jgi:hypothetical protein